MTTKEYKEYLGNPDFDYVLLVIKFVETRIII